MTAAAASESPDSNAVVRVLAVDDQPKNLLALTAMLEPLGQTVVTASSGQEALRQLLRGDFALILLDVQMPELDGYETAELIRSRSRSRNIPIIFLTAIQRDQRFVSRGYAVGAVDYILKPIDPEILRSKVSVFVELYRKNAIIRQQAEQLRRASERRFEQYKRWSEDQYTTLAESMPQIVWTASPTGDLRYCNRRWYECAGKDATDNLDWSHVLHPEDLPAFLEGWRTSLASHVPWQAEFRFGNAQDGYLWHLVHAIPKLGDSDDVVSWIGTSTDIDARKKAEQFLQMLANLTQRLGELLDRNHAIEGVLETALPLLGDHAFLDLRSESGARRRVGVPANEATNTLQADPRLDLGPDTVFFTGRPESHSDIEAELRDSRRVGRIEHAHFLQELGVRAYMCFPLIIRDTVFGALTFLTRSAGRVYSEREAELGEDVARRIATALDNLRLYEMAQAEREKIEEASRAKDLFLATLSHELRTPLNAIVGWGHMLRAGSLTPEKQERAIETIDRNGRALAQLVADLLDVSRIVAGNLKVAEDPVDLRPVVEAAIDAARPSAEAAGVTLHADLGEVAVEVTGDAARLQQIVGNLVANGVKFTESGGRVKVELKVQAEQVGIQVTDTGQGISAEFLPQVFDRFRQAAENRPRTHGGLGLGLAIVKHLVELHHGSVSATSAGLGKGSCFTIHLPLRARTTLAEASNDAGPTSEADSGVRPQNGALLHGIHALVVEDDPDGCEMIEAVLKGFGARVTAVSTAQAALSAVREAKPDVLVSDIGLPDEDGFELLKKIRAHDDLTTLPAIAVTAYASRQDVAKVLSEGFQAHVSKPVQPSELSTTIARVSGR